MLHELVLGLVGVAFGGWIGAMLHWRYGAGVHDAYGKEMRRRAKERRKNLIHSHQQIDDAIRALREKKKGLDTRKKPQPPSTHKLSGQDYDEYGLL